MMEMSEKPMLGSSGRFSLSLFLRENNKLEEGHQSEKPLFLITQCNTEEVDVEPEKKVVDALVLQEAAAKAARQKVDSSHGPKDTGNISEMSSESETEAGPEVETRVPCRARSYVVKSFDSKPEGRPQARHDPPTP
ncbi:hypothetical protein ACFX2J_046570 [Malus domestica]